MAIYRLEAGVIQRSKGGSSVGMAAYQSGENIEDLRTGILYKQMDKDDILAKGIIAPDNAPHWAYDRVDLWNQTEASSKRHDASTARTIIAVLPREFSHDQNMELVTKYITNNFVSKGMIADWAIHQNIAEDGEPNPHVHILLTKKEITKEGFGKVNRNWDKKNNLLSWRKSWADDINDMADRDQLDFTVSEKSYKDQGIDKRPQYHLGAELTEMERKGIKTILGDINRRIRTINKLKEWVKNGVLSLTRKSAWAIRKAKKLNHESARDYDEIGEPYPFFAGLNKKDKFVHLQGIDPPEPPDKGIDL